jgi:hypothetical protein
MNWPLWVALFGLNAAPISLLLADRLLALPAQPIIRWLGLPWLAALAAALAYGAQSGDPAVWLFGVGAFGGLLGTVALDVVRLAGVRAGAFPMDMPMMFGAIALGLAPRLQRNMMIRLVEHVSALPAEPRREMLVARLRAIARLAPAPRLAAVGAMRAGLERLPDDRRQAMVTTQMEAMATSLEPEERRALMAALDGVESETLRAPYGPPRGLPRIPMALFRALSERAFPDTLAEAGVGRGRVALAGYLWHALNGISFGAMYTLLVGSGNWALALGWGAFVWAAMMIAMPFMMPMVGFPRWFPVVPLLAHVAMIVPIGIVALGLITTDQSQASLLGALR